MRRSPLALTLHDTKLIRKKLEPILHDPQEAVGAYLERANKKAQRKA